MKNLSLILNAVLLVAVIVLFYLHFSSGSPAAATAAGAANIGDSKIAYIRSDSVLKNYEYLKVQGDALEAKSKQLQQDYRNRAIGLQNEMAAYQRNQSSMTLGQVRATEEDLGKKQQNLQMYEQSLSQHMMEEQSKLSKELYDRVTVFLKKYGEEKGLQLVLKLDANSDVLFAVDGLDISQDVTTGLNSEYKVEKAPGAKKDSTATKK